MGWLFAIVFEKLLYPIHLFIPFSIGTETFAQLYSLSFCQHLNGEPWHRMTILCKTSACLDVEKLWPNLMRDSRTKVKVSDRICLFYYYFHYGYILTLFYKKSFSFFYQSQWADNRPYTQQGPETYNNVATFEPAMSREHFSRNVSRFHLSKQTHWFYQNVAPYQRSNIKLR